MIGPTDLSRPSPAPHFETYTKKQQLKNESATYMRLGKTCGHISNIQLKKKWKQIKIQNP
jgi:hypothetical protein